MVLGYLMSLLLTLRLYLKDIEIAIKNRPFYRAEEETSLITRGIQWLTLEVIFTL
jgi:hypothetical protein